MLANQSRKSRQQITCGLEQHSKTRLRSNECHHLKWVWNEPNRRRARPHLDFWWGQRFPVVGFELVEFVKLQADVLNRQLEHVPETRQVLGDGPGVRVGVLTRRKSARIHTQVTEHTRKHETRLLFYSGCVDHRAG